MTATECIDGVKLEIEVNGVLVKARDSDHYVPTTELCKAGGKEWHDFVRLKSTDAFLEALAKNTGFNRKILVQSTRGRVGSTWIHPQVVIKFAQWVSPEFDVLVTKWAVALLTTGKAEVKAEDERSIPAGLPDRLAQLVHDMHGLLIEARTANARNEERIAQLEARASVPAHPRSENVGPLWTVQDLLNDAGWFTTTARQRADIRDRANTAIRRHTGQEVEKLHGHSVYTRPQLVFVDRAIRIERMKAQLEEAERDLGLFRGCDETGG
jgi:hypothetical protein